jgi:hypothetical protein
MSSQCLGRENAILVSRGFGRSTSTVNLARTICGLLFVLRFVTPSKRSNLRTDIRSKVVKLLDQRSIRHSSVDLVRFRWVEDEGDKENEDDEDDGGDRDDGDTRDDEDIEDVVIKVVPYGRVVITPVTIWVGVLPDTLTGEVAFHSSNDILDLLKAHGISDVEVAYRESVARGFSGPELFAPVSDYNPLKAVIDPVTTALSLPIAGLNTLNSHGTMGFYFRVDKDLYAVTARHVLFPEDEGNNPYSYVGTFFSPRR